MSEPPLYAPTPTNDIEVKRLPASEAYEARTAEDFFERRNDLFRRDFAFLRANELSMTVPVEAEIAPGSMRFFVPEGDTPHVPVEGVEVRELPERTVVSVGLRGRYTRTRYEVGVTRIAAWLREHPAWRRVGEPYAVYWDGPGRPWFLKRSEVHQRIEPA